MREVTRFRVGSTEFGGKTCPAVFQETLETQDKNKEAWGIKHVGVVVINGDRLLSVQGGVSLRSGWRLATLQEVRAHFVDAEIVGDDKATEESASKKFDSLVVS